MSVIRMCFWKIVCILGLRQGEFKENNKKYTITQIAIKRKQNSRSSQYYVSIIILHYTDWYLRALRPVSYTHLDVYKRQIITIIPNNGKSIIPNPKTPM